MRVPSGQHGSGVQVGQDPAVGPDSGGQFRSSRGSHQPAAGQVRAAGHHAVGRPATGRRARVRSAG
jgi:hypothetical protein